jgi:short-subunit dehydrogenase
MFQKPLHFDRTGVRVVAMCPGYTISNIHGNEKTLLVAEWITMKENVVYQPYA